jgi:hypothetical protein
MRRYRIEQTFVSVVAFLLGVGLAICVAPGDVLLWLLAGAVLAVFCREHFVRNCAGELFWWPHREHHSRKRPLKGHH